MVNVKGAYNSLLEWTWSCTSLLSGCPSFVLSFVFPQYSNSLCLWGVPFSVDHVLSCPKGSLPSLYHNEIRDLTATLLTEICSKVCNELELQPVHNPEDFNLSTSKILQRGLAWTLLWMVIGAVSLRDVLLMFLFKIYLLHLNVFPSIPYSRSTTILWVCLCSWE